MSTNAILALMAKLELLYGESKDLFLAFQNPGLPIDPRDLSFSLPSGESGLTPQESLTAAANFARLVNLVPAYSNVWSSDGRLLWDEYRLILTQALVASQSLTEAQIAELRAAEALVVDDSPKLTAYTEYEKAYLDALEQYNAKKLSAENSTDPRIQQQWQLEEPTYKSKLNRANANWMTKGFKAEIDEAFADIDRLTGGSPQLAWANWKQAFPNDPPVDLQGQEFYETSFIPNHFFKPDSKAQWTKLELDASEIATLSAKASDSIRQMLSSSKAVSGEAQALALEISHLSVELARVEIIRPWFKPSLFRNRFWKWSDAREPLSNGQEPPQGSLLGYPTSMIFARNLEIKLKPNSNSNQQIIKQLQSAKRIYLGPLRLGEISSRLDPKSVSALKSAHLASRVLKEFEPSRIRQDSTLQEVVSITFETYLDGTPISPNTLLTGNEFLSRGIRLSGAPESTYCADATLAAIRSAGTYSGITFPFLTSASPGNINRCNGVPVAISFIRPVQQVTLTFAGASVAYVLKAYNSDGILLGTIQKNAVLNAGTTDITFSDPSARISRVTFGCQTAVTAIKEIYYLGSPESVGRKPKLEGQQLIAFLCQKLPKSPDPDPNLSYS
jgi:hypothetical protein